MSSIDALRETNNTHAIVNREKDDHELVTCTGFKGKPDSEELYLFDKNLSLVEHPHVSHGMAKVSSADPILASLNFSTSVMTEAPHILQGNMPPGMPAGFVKVLRPVGHEDGPSHERGNVDGGRGSVNHKEGGLLFQDGHNGPYVNGKDETSGPYDSYNHLLKYGRLIECIELLEDMDREAVLDMDKFTMLSSSASVANKRLLKEPSVLPT